MTDLFSAPPTTGARPPLPSRSMQRRSSRSSAAARRRRRRRRLLVLVVALVVVGGAGWYVTQHVLPNLSFGFSTEAKDYPGPGGEAVEIRVQPGDTGTAIGRTLQEAGVVESVAAFTKAYAADPAASSIQPGVYSLKKEMKAADAVSMLAANTGRVDLSVTIPEGYTVDQVLSRTSGVTGISVNDLKTAMKDTKATGLPAQAKGNYEGWLFPATYSFDPDVTATEAVSAMVAQTVAQLDKLDVPKADRETVIIKASIVEREASRDEDFGKVARVIDNRLGSASATGGLLQIDATLAYALGRSGLTIAKSDLDDKSNPYNTYVHKGLPPGPISNPGAKAIAAVLDPTPGDWYWYVTVNLDTGETKFTDSYDQFLTYKAQMQAWLKANPQDGK